MPVNLLKSLLFLAFIHAQMTGVCDSFKKGSRSGDRIAKKSVFSYLEKGGL